VHADKLFLDNSPVLGNKRCVLQVDTLSLAELSPYRFQVHSTIKFKSSLSCYSTTWNERKVENHVMCAMFIYLCEYDLIFLFLCSSI
jgi:hypothetical protein